MKLLISERPGVAGLAFPNQSRLVASPGSEMAVEAVVRDIDLAADKPLRMRWLPLQHGIPFPEPVELAFSKPRQKAFGIGFAFRAQRFQFGHRFDVRLFGELGRWMKNAPFSLKRLDVSS